MMQFLGVDLQMKTSRFYYYRISGLVVASVLPLTRIPEIESIDTAVDVVIRETQLPSFEQSTWYHNFSLNVTLLDISDVARYLINHGREILVDPVSGAAAELVQTFLLGAAFAVLYHQRGLLPLHASAVQVHQMGIAFLGASGAGKSTLAGALARQGCRLICDDVCVVGFGFENEPLAYPGYPVIKLREDSRKLIEMEDDSHIKDLILKNKFHLQINAKGFQPYPLPLKRIYVLERLEAPEQPLIEKLTGFDALTEIATHTFRSSVLDSTEAKSRHFHLCSHVVQKVAVYRLCRPFAFDRLGDVVDTLRSHWRVNI
jgi:hypothetical protein